MYIPKPIDTQGVTMPPELEALTETLAENTHEVWSAGRIAQGWNYGPVRDDAKKQHPCLVKYSQLDEAEKEYDRNTAMQTIKLILKLGYTITKKDGEERR